MIKFKDYINEEDTDKEDKTLHEIMNFFATTPNPPDDKIHALAKRLGLEPDKFEEKIYKILGSVLGAGKANKKHLKPEDVNKKELEMGIKVEMEHTKNKAISQRIALDHLAEFPDYYTRLKKMEKEGEKGK